jgi:signal transduction histidine kinase/ligand-binding sensor domain-containing protein
MRVTRVLGAVLAGMVLAGPPCALALNPALDVSQYAHASWKYRDGFTKGLINDVAQTPDGFLWLATDFGLVRFDGVKPVPWEPPPDPSKKAQALPSTNVRKLFVARDGTLWISTLDGLASWKDGKLTQYPELSGFAVGRAIQDREGSIWAAARGSTVGKLCEIRNNIAKCYGESVLSPAPFALHEDRKGYLWVGVANGVWRWKPGPPEFYLLSKERAYVQDITEDRDGALLITSQDGLLRLIDGKIQMAYPFPALQRGLGTRMLRDRDGGLWAGTSGGGIVHFHQGRTDLFSQSDGLTGDTVGNFFEDREGNVWVPTINGLDRFRELPIVTYTTRQGFSRAPSGVVLAARDGSVWLSAPDGLNQVDAAGVTVYSDHGAPSANTRVIRTGGLPDHRASLFEDFGGRIWISSLSGVGYLENERYTPTAAPGGVIWAFTEDNNGDLWMANPQVGLIHLTRTNEFHRTPWETFGSQGVGRTLASNPSQGGVWIGFEKGGVTWLRDGRVQASYSAANGLGRGSVNDLRFDHAGVLWIATDGGLSLLRNGRLSTVTKENGLPCDAVHWTMPDDFGSVWLMTPCGLVRAKLSDLESWSTGRSIQTVAFDNTDGVGIQAAASALSPHVGKSPDGRLWFWNVDGIGVVDPHHLPFNKLPPPVLVEIVKVNGKEVAAAEGMDLSRGSNDLEIDYTALSLTIPERVHFQYKLEGKDTEWQDVGTRRQAYYTNLKPKKYRFRVMASNNDGVWNEAGATWNFSIVPAYYQTTWFLALCGAAGGGLLWLMYWLRLRQVTARVKLLYNERLAERTRIARDLHDTLLQSLAGVSLQLDGISKQAAKAPEKVPSLIARVREQVDSAFREARVKVWNLRSTSLEAQGLEGALHQLVERMGPATKARFEVAVSGQPRSCSHEVEEELLRIAQEAANNANRHAQASEIRIGLDYNSSLLTLTIADDGRGFDFQEGYGKSGHWGLKNMQERAAQIRGTCRITTAAGQGTRIEVCVPLSSSWSLRNTLAKHAHSSSDSR